MDKKKILAVFLAVLAILVVLISYFTNNDEDKEESIYIVKNYSNFYTVSSCINRLVDYISNKEVDSIFSILNDNYKKTNNISKNDILSVFDNYLENSYFEANEMYYQNVNNNITKFYVYGKISLSNAFEVSESVDSYFVVYLDKLNKTFSAEPYDAKSFEEVSKNGK